MKTSKTPRVLKIDFRFKSKFNDLVNLIHAEDDFYKRCTIGQIQEMKASVSSLRDYIKKGEDPTTADFDYMFGPVYCEEALGRLEDSLQSKLGSYSSRRK